MWWEKIKEIIDLGSRVYNETPAFFSISVCTESGMCNIYIMDEGFKKDTAFDGYYTIFFDSMAQEEFNCRQFEKAKNHMIKLLGEEVNTNDV